MSKTSRKTGKQLPAAVQWGVLGAFVLGCGMYSYFQIAAPATPAAPPPPVIVTKPSLTVPGMGSAPAVRPSAGVKPAEARNVGSIAQLDPTLHMEAMLVTESLVYSGSGRNIFSINSAPIEIPKPVATARGPVVPIAPPSPVPTGPPPPPPIDLKFFGTVNGTNGRRQAFLLHGEDVYTANEGDIVGRRYKVIAIGTGSVVVEDMPNSNRQTLPLEAQ